MSAAEAADELVGSAEAGALLGVSASTIKRWVDEGELRAERTAGGHRRIRRAQLEQLRARLAAPATGSATERLVELLLETGAPQRLDARLLALRGETGSALGVTLAVAPALVELGLRWQRGRISVAEEHLASERLARSLARLAEWTPLAEDAPRALLASADGEEHTLGLSLVELLLRQAGFATLWAGRNTPTADLVHLIEEPTRQIRVVALSASAFCRDRRRLERQEATIGRACARAGATLVIGGSGAWPASPRHARLVRELTEADALFTRLRRDFHEQPAR